MMYKLSDPGVVLTTVGHEKIGRKFFHKVQVDYDSKIIGKEDNDAYLLYINSESNLVERFHFSIPEDGAHEGVKVVVDYKTVNGLKVPAKRSMKMGATIKVHDLFKLPATFILEMATLQRTCFLNNSDPYSIYNRRSTKNTYEKIYPPPKFDFCIDIYLCSDS